MPVYEYECIACKNRFERTQRFSDEPERICPSCGAEVRRVYHPVGIVFKGSGFYITDSRKDTGDKAASGSSSEGSSSGSSDSAKSTTSDSSKSSSSDGGSSSSTASTPATKSD